MILLREVSIDDLDGLEEISRIAAEYHPGFLNISSDREQWKEKVDQSVGSFSEKIKNIINTKYIFVAEDLTLKKIVGISMVAGQHGNPETPHFYFEVSSEQKFSQTISTGFIHGTLKLRWDTDGPSEVGGLLVNPEFRKSDEKIGRQISFVRFLFMGLHLSKFKKKTLAELLPPLTKRGKSPLWEAVGRRFTNMDYTEADILSGKNKEFILSLFPTEKIYVSLLSAEARNAIGRVSKDTEPVMHMLKKIGFNFANHVDPFDGGPHLTAITDEIVPIKNIKTYSYGGNAGNAQSDTEVSGLITLTNQKLFRSVAVNCKIIDQNIFFDQERGNVLSGGKISQGDQIVFMPYY